MIDPRTLKTQLSGLTSRAATRADAEMWGTGELIVTPEELIPDVPDAARTAFTRLAKQAQSIASRVVKTKKYGVLGNITWGGDDTRLDQRLREQDLDALADEILEQSYYSGIMAGIARRDPITGDMRLEPIIGHVEPIYSPDSPTLAVGLLHAWRDTPIQADGSLDTTGQKWFVRVYDTLNRRMLQWNALSDVTRVAKQPPDLTVERSSEYPSGAPVPRFQVTHRGYGRQPLGVIAQLLPLVKSDWSSQVRGDRAEENTAFSQLVVKGSVEDGTSERSTNHVITLNEGGDAHYLDPASMETFHKHHDRKLERLREDANMPGGFLGRTGSAPSGEALREANEKFISSNQYDAQRLSRVLTDLTRDLAEAEGLDQTIEVSVSINWNFMRGTIITDTINVHKAGLIDKGAAVRTISQFFPTWSDDDVEAFITREARNEPPPDTLPTEQEAVAV